MNIICANKVEKGKLCSIKGSVIQYFLYIYRLYIVQLIEVSIMERTDTIFSLRLIVCPSKYTIEIVIFVILFQCLSLNRSNFNFHHQLHNTQAYSNG